MKSDQVMTPGRSDHIEALKPRDSVVGAISCQTTRGQTWSIRSLALLLLCLVPIASTPLASAQGVVLAEAQAVAAEADEEELIIDPGFEIAESNFDQWIFGVQYADQGVKRIESLLTLKVEAVNQACELTEDQRAKLKLAGDGDIQRFYDDVAIVRAKFMKVRRNRNAFNNIWQDIQPLQVRVNAGLFDQSSFLAKVLHRTLNDEQTARYEESELQRRQFRYGAKLALVVAMMERTMPLRAAQRGRFIQVLKEETKPPRVFGQYDYYLVLYQLTKVSEEKLKPIFDEAQWKAFQHFTAQGRGMEMFLKQQKVLP